jgi:YVTN family beta-propeller protein
VANPDNNTVTIFNVENDRNAKVGELYVGQEPNGVALTPDGRRLFVANTVSGTVSVLVVDRAGQNAGRLVANIPVGTEPYGLAMTPNGTKLYVANARSNTVSVIDVRANRVVKTIDNVGLEPRGLAITNDGDGDDDDETLLVTQFLALPVATGKPDGEDDSKVALVTSVNTGTDAVNGTIVLRPLANTGFLAAGDAIARQAPPAAPVAADFRFVTGAYPNQLNNVVIKDRFAFVPNTGASPNGPTRFNVNTQSLLHVIDLNTRADANQTINMHRAIATQTSTDKLFPTVPWAIGHKYRSNEAYVVSAASDIVIKLNINPANGAATVANHPTDNTRTLRIPVGRNPRGIIINGADTRAYVMNYVSRDVSIIDLRASPERVLGALASAPLPERGSREDIIQLGKELYNSSVGTFDPAVPNGPTITGRLSNEGWGSCSSCHPNGLSDNVVWIFAAGPRRTVSQHLDYDINDPNNQKLFNWSAIFDEQEDFELNIRNVSGGAGLIVSADGTTPETVVAAFTPPNANRRQLKVRGINSWDAPQTLACGADAAGCQTRAQSRSGHCCGGAGPNCVPPPRHR